MSDSPAWPTIPVCPSCGAQVPGGLLACPACQRLVHAERLRQFATTAETAAARGDVSAALEAWRTALTLLPPETRQHQTVIGKIAQLSRLAETQTSTWPGSPATAAKSIPPLPASPSAGPTWRETQPPKKKAVGAIAATLGTVGLLAWKFKAVLVFALTKGKFLLLGLTKANTFFSMLLSMGAYWALFGWKFAVGLVVSIYIHEMGHVFALNRYGIKATAPMFIPGLGAMIRLKQYPTLPREDAMVGLAGPLWGLGAAVAAWLVSIATGWASWAAIAQVGAWVNLFNLMPIWQLDGSRGFRALVRWQRLAIGALFAGAWLYTHDGLLALLSIVALGVSFATKPAEKSDNEVFAYFAALILALSALTEIPVQAGAL